MTAAVLAGGELVPSGALRQLAQSADLVVAADGGLRHAAGLGVRPDLILGDFDSVSEVDLKRYGAVPRQRYPADKDALDLELALEHALDQGATRLYLLGALGGRFDQSLAAVFIAARHAAVAEVSLYGSHDRVHLLRAPCDRRFDTPPEQRFSLLSLCDSSSLSVRGARYGLEHASITFGVGLGVSNRVTEPPLHIQVHQGLCTLILDDRD